MRSQGQEWGAKGSKRMLQGGTTIRAHWAASAAPQKNPRSLWMPNRETLPPLASIRCPLYPLPLLLTNSAPFGSLPHAPLRTPAPTHSFSFSFSFSPLPHCLSPPIGPSPPPPPAAFLLPRPPHLAISATLHSFLSLSPLPPSSLSHPQCIHTHLVIVWRALSWDLGSGLRQLGLGGIEPARSTVPGQSLEPRAIPHKHGSPATGWVGAGQGFIDSQKFKAGRVLWDHRVQTPALGWKDCWVHITPAGCVSRLLLKSSIVSACTTPTIPQSGHTIWQGRAGQGSPTSSWESLLWQLLPGPDSAGLWRSEHACE